MSIGPQPRRSRGTVGHPYSALNLRLALASFGLVLCAGLAVVLFWRHLPIPGAFLVLLAITALVDIVVIQLRRRARRRADPGQHTFFE
jgi:hypothetical protein